MAILTPWLNSFLAGFLAMVSSALAQFPSPFSNDTAILLESPINPNVTVRYTLVHPSTCATVFSTQKQYSGYITLPPNLLDPTQGNYPINTFFWFFEARQQPESAPLTIFINGGPGSSSMVGLFQEVGPCKVVELSQRVLGTTPRDWGWDRSSNILFIDQPVQVGFSYDTTTNSSFNLLDQSRVTPPADPPPTQPQYTFLNGTFASGNPALTANTSQIAARSIWHFLQTFLTAFPEYNTALRREEHKPTAEIHIFTESYGGRYGPAIGSFFKSQNDRRGFDADFASHTVEITLRSLGIINGWIDLLVQAPYHPRFAYQNTYGIQAISQLQQLNALSAFAGTDGSRQLTTHCRAEQTNLDPNGDGHVDLVNELCSRAQLDCQIRVAGPYTVSDRSIYDITQNKLDPFPDSLYLDYLNQIPVQRAIGVPVNYTQDSFAVFDAFNATGDYARDGHIQALVDLLEAGTHVALIYGDRDYICNWLGGEAVSFAVAAAAASNYGEWYSAGYAPIVANETYIGGVVRQYGNLSFSRIYDAGHLVPAYQPETAFTVFSRIIKDTDISTGNIVDLSTYRSEGDANSTHENIAPEMAEPTCYIRAMDATCNNDQKNMIINDVGVIINGVLYNQSADWAGPSPPPTSQAVDPLTLPPSIISSVSRPTTMYMNSSITVAHSNRSQYSPAPTARSTWISATEMTSEVATTRLPTGVFTATSIPATTNGTSVTTSTGFMARRNIFSHALSTITLTSSSTETACVVGIVSLMACWFVS